MAGEPHLGRARRGIGHQARWLVITFLALVAAWLVLAIHPQPLFAYSASHANVVLHARDPLPRQADVLLDEVVRRVSRSPLYDGARIHHVFLCDSPALFALFTLWNLKAGAVAQVYLGSGAGDISSSPHFRMKVTPTTSPLIIGSTSPANGRRWRRTPSR